MTVNQFPRGQIQSNITQARKKDKGGKVSLILEIVYLNTRKKRTKTDTNFFFTGVVQWVMSGWDKLLVHVNSM